MALAVAGCAPAAPGPRDPGPSAFVVPSASAGPSAAPAIRIYQIPHVAGGGPSLALSELGNTLNEFAARHPTVFSGTWFAPEQELFVVGVALPKDPAAAELEALRGRLDPGLVSTRTVPARFSWAQLEAMKQQIVDDFLLHATAGVNGVGLDVVNNAVVVTILRSGKDPALTDNVAVLAIAAKYADAVEFEETSSPATAG